MSTSVNHSTTEAASTAGEVSSRDRTAVAVGASPLTSELRSVDRDLLLALRGSDAAGIGELTDLLGVTATAVRQRIDRLLETGLIEREKVVAGRGRPTYQYRLTVAGHQRAGANPAELADAMWREILAVEDAAVRDALISGVAARLGRQFADLFGLNDESLSLEDRMKRLSEILSQRQIDSSVIPAGSLDILPVLDVCSCPYPSLTDVSDDRAMCKLEEKMFSEALGKEMHLSSCRLDGDDACQFSAVEKTVTNQNTSDQG